jgi:hypothetical protein
MARFNAYQPETNDFVSNTPGSGEMNNSCASGVRGPRMPEYEDNRDVGVGIGGDGKKL